MSVKIKSGAGTAEQTVGETSKGGYVEARDEHGNAMGLSHRDLISPDQSGFLMLGKNDDTATIMRTDRKGNQMVGNFIPELQETFEGATVNAQKWTASATSFTAAQSTLAGYNFNSAGIAGTAAAVTILQTQRLFPINLRVPMQHKLRLRHALVSGSLADFGFGVPSGTTTIVPNGVCFRLTTSGVVQGVITYNGAEIAIDDIESQVASNGNVIGAALNMSDAYYAANYFVYDLVIEDDNALFTIQDTQTGEIIGELSLALPIAFQSMMGATALPIYHRLFNQAIPATIPVFIVTKMQTLSLDWRLTPDMSQLAASLGLSAGRQPFTGVQNENHTNSTAPVSATLSNTAAGYTTLGGKFQFAAVAGAITDYALFGFQVPAGARFVCEGIRIMTRNTGAAVATTASTLEWAMGFNSSAVSLATANIIRRQVGYQSFPIAAAIEASAAELDITFETPEVVESSRFLHVILTLPVGTATASQILRGQIMIKGRFI